MDKLIPVTAAPLKVETLQLEPETKEIKGPFEHLKVGVYDYKVKWLNDLMEDCIPGEVDDGCTDSNSLTMRITVEPSKRKVQAIVLHEVLHAVLGASVQPKSNEEVAETSPLLLQVLRENPELVKFLLEK